MGDKRGCNDLDLLILDNMSNGEFVSHEAWAYVSKKNHEDLLAKSGVSV